MKSDLRLLWLPLALANHARAESLSLADCLSAARRHDPAIRMDSLSREGSVLAERSVLAAWKPSVTASVSYQRLSPLDPAGVELPLPAALGGPRTMVLSPDIPDQYAASLRVEQLLWDGGRGTHQASAARSDQEAASAARERSLRDLAAKVATAYWNLQAAQAAHEAARKAAERADSQAVQTATAFRQGAALEQDTLQARLRVRQIELSIEQARASKEFAEQILCTAMGESASCALSASDPLVPLAPLAAPAVPPRPELRQVRQQILSAREGIEAAKAGYRPVVQASAQVDLMDPHPRVVPARDEFETTWKVGAVASWNLYRGGADDLAVRRATLAEHQARLREAQLRDAIGQESERRATEWRLARRRREIAEANLPLARRDLELARIRARAGVALGLEAIDRASALAQAESDLAQAVAAENIAVLNLSLARGEEPRWR